MIYTILSHAIWAFGLSGRILNLLSKHLGWLVSKFPSGTSFLTLLHFLVVFYLWILCNLGILLGKVNLHTFLEGVC